MRLPLAPTKIPIDAAGTGNRADQEIVGACSAICFPLPNNISLNILPS